MKLFKSSFYKYVRNSQANVTNVLRFLSHCVCGWEREGNEELKNKIL